MPPLTERTPKLAKSYKSLPLRDLRPIIGLHRSSTTWVKREPCPGREAREAMMRRSDDRIRSAARGGDPAAAALRTRADPGFLSGRRSRPELPDSRRRQT